MRQISLQVPPNSSAVFEAQLLVQAIGVALGGSRPGAAITAATRRLKFSYSRTERFWYAKSKLIRAEEMDRLRAVAAEVDKERAFAAVVALREHLAAAGQENNRRAIDALDRALGEMGKKDRRD